MELMLILRGIIDMADRGKQAVIDLRLKCLTDIGTKSFLLQRATAVSIIKRVEYLEKELKTYESIERR